MPLLLLAFIACVNDPASKRGEGPATPASTPAVDADGDGWAADVDCDDAAPQVHPEATEVCNGRDDDCDGQVDRDDPSLSAPVVGWHDGDGDGWGSVTVVDCSEPPGVVQRPGDCDDTDRTVHPGRRHDGCDGVDNDCDGAIDEDPDRRVYADNDGDGFGDPDVPTDSCTIPPGHVADGTDCDDTDPSDGGWRVGYIDGDRDGYGAGDLNTYCRDQVIAPTGDDCDDDFPEVGPVPVAWYADADGDGFGGDLVEVACARPEGLPVPVDGDCDDTDPTRNPSLEERCTGIDDDCDGLVDDADPDRVGAVLWYFDADGDGAGSGDGVLACYVSERHVRLGLDCDDDDPDLGGPVRWTLDGDGDGFGAGERTLATCDRPGFDWVPHFRHTEVDCDDADPTSYPHAPEVCDDDVDHDCDGVPVCNLYMLGGYRVPQEGRSVTRWDHDHDGVLDMIGGNGPFGGVARIAPAPEFADLAEVSWPGSRPHSERLDASADLNGDGFVDLVIAARGIGPGIDTTVVHLDPLPDGEPLLSGPLQYDSPELQRAVGLGDVDGDGLGDLAVQTDGVFLLHGPPPDAGPLDAIAALTDILGTVWPAGDLDGDGLADVLTVDGSEVRVTPGPVLGEEPRLTLDGIRTPEASVIGDLDGDGLGELAVARHADGQPLHIVPGQLDGAHDVAEVALATLDAWTVTAPVARDVDGDGVADLVLVMQDDGLGLTTVFGPVSGEIAPTRHVTLGPSIFSVFEARLWVDDLAGGPELDALVMRPAGGWLVLEDAWGGL
ncbi:MAG: hypothetical protein ACI8PZ_006028 [Myxococcota bacterium]|jgi:hypothetical protein